MGQRGGAYVEDRHMKADTPDFRAFFEASPGQYLILSAELKIVAVTDVFCRNTMTERAKIMGLSVFDVFPDNPDDANTSSVASLRLSLMRVLETRRQDVMGVVKYDIRKPDSEGGGFEERFWSPVNTPILGADGEIRWILNQAEDVTDQVRASTERSAQERRVKDQDIQIALLNTANRELARQIAENNRLQEDQQKIAGALTSSEERFRTLATNLPGVVYRRLMHPDGSLHDIYVSPGVRDLLGVDPEEFTSGKITLLDFAHPEDHDRKLNALKEYGAKLKTLVIEVRKVSRDKKIHWWQIHTTPKKLENGDIQWDGIALDVTELKITERQLQQAVKMEAVGQLTGGVAHDFNNLLTVILANAEILAEELESNPPLQALAKLAQKAAERGADLTKGLLAFSRRQALEPQPVDVNKLIARMDDLLRRSLGEEIEIETVTGAGLWRAQIDPTQLESALLNLAINARDAMPGGGKLTIETVNAHVDLTYSLANDEVTPGQYVLVCVSDTGSGIDKDVLARVFEPFFSTKEVGKGTGLGLSMVFGFVKQSGGHIKIYSELGKGTTVKLYLPRSYEARGAGDAAVSMKQEEPHGSETILLVEDDELVRTHVEGLLQHLGYKVVVAHNGVAGLALLEQGLNVDLLFTDVVMPGGMSGRQLVEKVKALRPNLKTLYTSGYTENAIVHHGHLDPGVHLIRKPYRRQELALKLRAVLDEK
jgi:PAS domain S-box-containing protein